MIAWILRRLLASVAVVAIVALTCFVLMRALPGGPFDTGRQSDPRIEANLRAAYDLDAPVLDQFARWAGGLLLRGDLGPSLRHRDHGVSEILGGCLPVSLALGILALGMALGVGLPAGALAARHRGKTLDTLVMGAATLGLAVPNFVLASALVLLFAFHWQLFPVAGTGSLLHLVLPALALGLPFAATVARLFRSALLDVLGEDWVRTARAKGASPLRVIWIHAARPASLPVVAALGPNAAGILAGSLVVERVFAIGGLGTQFVESALDADYNVALGAILVYAVLLTTANLLADLAGAVLDPRTGEP